MPAEIYGTLYNQHDLNIVITMVRHLCQETRANQCFRHCSGATPGAPFTVIKTPHGNTKRVYFQDEGSLSDRIERLTNTLY